MHHQMQQSRYICLKNMAFARRYHSFLVHVARFAFLPGCWLSEGSSAPQYRGVAFLFQGETATTIINVTWGRNG